MTKSELVEIIAAKQTQLSVKDVELAVKTIIDLMSETLAEGPVSYTHLRAHETKANLVCRLLLEKKNKKTTPH